MKCQILFSGKNLEYKYYQFVPSAELAQKALRQGYCYLRIKPNQ